MKTSPTMNRDESKAGHRFGHGSDNLLTIPPGKQKKTVSFTVQFRERATDFF